MDKAEALKKAIREFLEYGEMDELFDLAVIALAEREQVRVTLLEPAHLMFDGHDAWWPAYAQPPHPSQVRSDQGVPF